MTVSIDDLAIDVALSEDHGYESTVTDHPAESGSEFVDNVINKPLVITLDCIISATPFGSAPVVNRLESSRARLLAIRELREPVTVVDSQGTFPSMILEKLNFTKTAKTGRSLAFKCTFKELTVITNERTIIHVSLPRVQNATKNGSKSSVAPPTDKPPDSDTDPLARAAGGIAKLFHSDALKDRKPNQGF